MSLTVRLIDSGEGVRAALGDLPVEAADALRSLSADAVIELVRRLGDLARVVDALGALASSELTHRIQTDDGFRRATIGGGADNRFSGELMRDLTRLDDDTVRSWEKVGEAISMPTSLQGQVLPSRHEPVARAVLAAEITAKHAAIIAGGMDRVAAYGEPDALRAIESTLVEYAGSLTTRQLGKLVRQLPDRLDPDGAEPREDALRARAKITVRELENGMTRVVAELHPVAAGLFKTVMDAHTAPRRAVAFAETPEEVDALVDDRRSLAERRVDAFEGIMRDALRHDTGSVAGTAVTMLVTVGLDELRSGIGVAQLAGVDEPISAATARRMAADAELIPVVLGCESEVLDLGRGSRLFSEAQRRAMVARDGGCIWPGCNAPPAWCEAAHLVPWLPHGKTDLDNGALMCAGHHHRFDRDGWQLIREGGVPYLVPPPWLDPQRTPRRAGRVPQLVA